MYDWLEKSLADDDCQVVTANRRLARTLTANYAQSRIDAGLTAWKSPAIFAWHDWLSEIAAVAHDEDFPIRINVQQSRVLWEQCLRADLDEPLLNIAALARQCHDTWMRMNEWQLPLAECQNVAQGQDQRIFARCAGRYLQRLEQRKLIDAALLPDYLANRVRDGKLHVPRRIVLAGFDRVTPQAQSLLDAMDTAGSSTAKIDQTVFGDASLKCLDNADAELRAAGLWARDALTQNPDEKIAIVVSNLEQQAERSAHLLREGLAPGWQYGNPRHAAAINVSYGQKLSSYPAIHVALLALRWLHHDLTGTDVSQLLRSPFIGRNPPLGRSRLELRLREMPDRRWSRSLLLAALHGQDDSADAVDWLERVNGLDSLLADLPEQSRPVAWAEHFDTLIRALNWPGEDTLNSADYQLDNRWRDLLNEFAHLELVCPRMSGREAVSRLTAMAADTVFQAESDTVVVNVLGPLEAAGMQFDRIWVSGMTAANWPPASRPLVLLSRELQRQYGMPDAVPDDTAQYSERVLQRLRASARECVFSFPLSEDDAEQLPAGLLSDLIVSTDTSDPGWHAQSLRDTHRIVAASDRVPAVNEDESISGGAATIDRQMHEPFSAFAYGRLGIRWMPAFAPGIAANIRGNLIHDALSNLYVQRPSCQDIRDWSDASTQKRVKRAIDNAFKRHERHADSVLKELFKLERHRAESLLLQVVDVDRQRPGFKISEIETGIEAMLGDLRLSIRCDRLDALDDNSIIILDYKSGIARKFIANDVPASMQLVVYACAVEQPVTGLGLFNVNSRSVAIDAAGPAFADAPDWHASLDEWKHQVLLAAEDIVRGDVRMNAKLASRDTRPLSLLSRIAEIKHDY